MRDPSAAHRRAPSTSSAVLVIKVPWRRLILIMATLLLLIGTRFAIDAARPTFIAPPIAAAAPVSSSLLSRQRGASVIPQAATIGSVSVLPPVPPSSTPSLTPHSGEMTGSSTATHTGVRSFSGSTSPTPAVTHSIASLPSPERKDATHTPTSAAPPDAAPTTEAPISYVDWRRPFPIRFQDEHGVGSNTPSVAHSATWLPSTWRQQVHSTLPFFVDVFLADECVVALVPVANLSWQVLINDTMLQVGNDTMMLRPVHFGPFSSKNAVHVLRWCVNSLHGVPSVAVHLHVPGASARLTLTRDRDEATARMPPRGIAACTLFQDWGEFAIWSRYLLAIGIEHVVGYFNGGPVNNASFPTPYAFWPSPPAPNSAVLAQFSSVAKLVSDGRVTLHAWTVPYRLFAHGDPPEAQLYANAACLHRYFPRFSSILLMDTDEFLVVNSSADLQARNLTALFTKNKCFKIKATFASSGYNITGLTEFRVASFAAAGAQRDVMPVKQGYQKYALRHDAQLWYRDPHSHPDCRIDEDPAKYTFLHVTNWRRHDSDIYTTTKDVGRVPTTALVDTLDWARGHGSGSGVA